MAHQDAGIPASEEANRINFQADSGYQTNLDEKIQFKKFNYLSFVLYVAAQDYISPGDDSIVNPPRICIEMSEIFM